MKPAISVITYIIAQTDVPSPESLSSSLDINYIYIYIIKYSAALWFDRFVFFCSSSSSLASSWLSKSVPLSIESLLW